MKRVLDAIEWGMDFFSKAGVVAVGAYFLYALFRLSF